MATLGRTTITELNLLNKLTNDNIANPQITINGTSVPLGGSTTISTGDTRFTAGVFPRNKITGSTVPLLYSGTTNMGKFGLVIAPYNKIVANGNTQQSAMNANSITAGETEYFIEEGRLMGPDNNPGTATYSNMATVNDVFYAVNNTDVKSHASTATTYGVGTSSEYGHVKVISGDLNGKSASFGYAASQSHTHSQYATTASVSQLDTELNNRMDYIIEEGTVNNANKIGGQTIGEIIEQLKIQEPTYDTTVTTKVVGYDNGQTYTSDVIIQGNSVLAPNGFYQESDERLKTFVCDVEVDLEKIAELPKKFFYWIDRPDEGLQIGTSAQEVQKVYPELVQEGKDGKLVVDYAKFSVIALKAIDILNTERKQMKSDIDRIKEKLGL